MPIRCKICQRDFEAEPVRRGANSLRELCSECLLLCRRQRQPGGPETMILHALHQYLIARGVVEERRFVAWKAMPDLACSNTPKFWSECIFGDFLERSYVVTYVYGGNKEQVAAFGRKIQAAFTLNVRENTNRFPLGPGHLIFQVDNVAEAKRPENNPSIGQYCVKLSIVSSLLTQSQSQGLALNGTTQNDN